ncbi:MAG TPA: cytochrome c [Steroidobacter sp.]|jgi:mono/diheme cytochrome c family protein|nr:cytochrome c [Steroidobacter sp.]
MLARRCTLIAAVALLASCRSQPQPAVLQSMSGMQLYETLCASCHGVSAKGDGPIAPLIKTGVPDLTRIAKREGGEFPTEDVRRTIDGRFDRSAHGPRDMPVWGWRLYDSSSSDEAGERARTDSMIERLVEYLRSIQEF